MRIRKWFYQFMVLALLVTLLPGFTGVASAASTKQQTINFPLSNTMSQQKTIQIKDLLTVDKAEVDTGTVSFTKSGENVTIRVNNGTPVGPKIPSKIGTTYLENTSGSFPATTSYNDGTFRGPVSKSGSVTSYYGVTGGSPASSKSASMTGNGTTPGCGYQPSPEYGLAPSSIPYSEGEYSGTLYKSSQGVTGTSVGEPCGDGTKTTYWVYWYTTYTGTISKPDTRTYGTIYHQEYSGEVFGDTIYDYVYNVTLTFTVKNTDPKLNLAKPIDNNLFGMAYTLPISGTVQDSDIGDELTVKYTIDNGPTSTLTNLVSTGVDQNFSGDVPLSSYSRGKHTLQVWTEDNNNGKSSITTKQFTVLSSNANLSGFINDYTGPEKMRPAFKKETTGYMLSVEHEVEHISVTPTTEETWSSLKVNGETHTSGAVTPDISLKVGINNINMEVTAEDGITKKNYQLRVTRLASKNVGLSNLQLSDGTLSPNFDVKVFDYTASVPFGTKTITVTPTVEDAEATITVNNVNVINGSPSKPVALNVGSNLILVRVTAADGETTNSTQIIVTRQGNTDAKLNSLIPSTGGLNPSFSPDQQIYSMNVPSDVDVIRFTPLASDSDAEITINGKLVMNGEESSAIHLQNGENKVSIIVTAQDGSTKEYTVNINREVSSDARLGKIEFTDVSIRPVFNPETHTYTGTALPTVTSTTVTANTSDSNATMEINGVSVSNGVPTPLDLQVGTNIVEVTVTSPVGVKSSYTFSITRAGSSNALLADMWLSAGSLSPAFSSTINDYNVDVGSDVESIRLTAISDDNNAKIKIQNEVFASGETSNPIPLASENTVIKAQVIAGNGITTNTYTITVRKALSSSAELKKIQLSYGTLSPAFSSGVYAYVVEVPFSVPSISVIPTASPGSKLKVNGKLVQNGASSSSISLVVGNNPITIEVTSPDSSSTQVYQIIVNREQGNTGPVKGFMVSPIDTQLVAMFSNPNKDLVTGELWHNGIKENSLTSRSNTIVFGSNGTRISVKKGEVYTVKITYRSTGATAQETVTALGSPDSKATPISNLRLAANTSTAATLMWDAPPDKTPATEYTVQIVNEANGKRIQSVRVKEERYEFKKVVSGTPYRYEVQRTDVHRKPSDPVVLSEKSADLYDLSQPTHLSTSVVRDTITLRWQGEGDSFEVTALLNGSEIRTVTTAYRSWAVRKEPGTWEFRVTAKKKGYKDSASATITLISK